MMMDSMDIEKIEEMLRSTAFRNDEHKEALREELLGDVLLDDDELLLVAGGTGDDEIDSAGTDNKL